MVVAVLAGVVRGIATLVQATAVTDRWGAAHYGQLSGVLAAPVTVAAAVAPWVGAVLADVLGGYAAMFWAMAALAAAGTLLGLASVPHAVAAVRKQARHQRRQLRPRIGCPLAGSQHLLAQPISRLMTTRGLTA